ncbi:TPA: sce7726 family protein [Stenotrophomonas maltophilia]|uniref:sce7726 family protein n=1 Tax=Stenotrophomonas maltophilia TaxID=40324 RepID=UPI0018D4A49F|nr:sce7726 family protein [Stenotrophomonas maltophilia]HDS1650392.1 sce7726 family protein [Stenotrophomonas maltophilia]
MNYASDEKLRIIQWLLPQLLEGQILAAELPFKNVSRKADIAVLSATTLSAIEVKGPRDNLDSLAQQAEDYQQSFLEFYVAVAPMHLAAASAIVKRSAGLIELTSDGAVLRRKAKKRQNLAPIHAVDWLQTNDLAKLLGPQSRGIGITKSRELAISSTSKGTLTALAVNAVYRRALIRYKAFSAERGQQLTLDDVAMLELPTRIR